MLRRFSWPWLAVAAIWLGLCGILWLRALMSFPSRPSTAETFATVFELGMWGIFGLLGLIVCLFQARRAASKPQ